MNLEVGYPTWPAGHPTSRVESARIFERGQFLQVFESVFNRSVSSHSGCLSIEGGWGMGKTTLLNAACLIADRSSCLVFRARGGGLEQLVSFGVLRRILEEVTALRNADGEIAERIETVWALINTHGEHNYGELGAAFYEFLLAVRRLGPVLLAIDDADQVDDATLTTLQYVFHRIDDQQIWLLVTSSPRLSVVGPRMIDHLLVGQHVRHFVLEPLSPDGVRSIFAESSGQVPDPNFVKAVFEATAGRPEFVAELANVCRSEHITPSAETARNLDELPVPQITRMALVRLERLHADAIDLLEACTIHGNRTDLGSASRLARIEPESAERAADALARAELIHVGRPLVFTAPIVRWSLLQDIAPARRSQLHGQCAEYLTEIGASATAVVKHLVATEPSGNLELAARLGEVGRDLIEGGDVGLAARCLRRSLDESPQARQEASLWLDLARCETQLGRRSSVSSLQKAITLGTTDDAELFRVAIKLMQALRDWPDLRVETVAMLRKLTSRLQSVDPELQLEFELGLTILAGHPAMRSDGVAKIEGLLARSDTTSEIYQVANAFLNIHHFESDPSISAKTVIGLLKDLSVIH